MNTTSIQSWHSTNVAIIVMLGIALNPTKESSGSKREVWQEQLISPLVSDVAMLEDAGPAPLIPLLLAKMKLSEENDLDPTF